MSQVSRPCCRCSRGAWAVGCVGGAGGGLGGWGGARVRVGRVRLRRRWETGQRLAAVQLMRSLVAAAYEVAAVFGVSGVTLWRWGQDFRRHTIGPFGLAGRRPPPRPWRTPDARRGVTSTGSTCGWATSRLATTTTATATASNTPPRTSPPTTRRPVLEVPAAGLAGRPRDARAAVPASASGDSTAACEPYRLRLSSLAPRRRTGRRAQHPSGAAAAGDAGAVDDGRSVCSRWPRRNGAELRLRPGRRVPLGLGSHERRRVVRVVWTRFPAAQAAVVTDLPARV